MGVCTQFLRPQKTLTTLTTHKKRWPVLPAALLFGEDHECSVCVVAVNRNQQAGFICFVLRFFDYKRFFIGPAEIFNRFRVQPTTGPGRVPCYHKNLLPAYNRAGAVYGYQSQFFSSYSGRLRIIALASRFFRSSIVT